MTKERKFLHQDKDWLEGLHIYLELTEVVFLEQIVTSEDEGLSNVSKRLSVETWKSGIAELLSGSSSATLPGLTLQRLPDDQIRIEWVREMTHDERCFPMGAKLGVTENLARLVVN